MRMGCKAASALAIALHSSTLDLSDQPMVSLAAVVAMNRQRVARVQCAMIMARR